MRLFRTWVIVAGIVGLMATGAIAEDLKIGVVDLQKALQTVEEGKKAKTTLEKEFNDKKKQLQTEEESIKKLSDEFKKQSMVLSDDAKARKQGEIQERLVKYRELFGKSQMDIQNRERQLTEPIIVKLRSVVDDVAAKKNYTMVFERNDSSVLYLKQKDDLTDEVIRAYNSKK